MTVGTPGANLCIFTGDRIFINRGGNGGTTSVLPEQCRGSVVQIHRTEIYDKMLEAIRVEFKNGNFATLFMNLVTVDPINDEDLMEFRATCLMIHDL